MLFNVPIGQVDLFRDLEQIRNEMDRIFTTAFDRFGTDSYQRSGSFPVNLYAADDELVLTAEVPGVSPEDVSLTIEDNLLTLGFKRDEQPLPEGSAYHRRERVYGSFARTIELPIRVDSGKAQARADNGVLQVRLPRLEADKPRKISIQTTH